MGMFFPDVKWSVHSLSSCESKVATDASTCVSEMTQLVENMGCGKKALEHQEEPTATNEQFDSSLLDTRVAAPHGAHPGGSL